MSTRPGTDGGGALVGVFDSGVGGLTVVRELMRQYPDQPLLYLADQAHVPYGGRPLAEIRELMEAVTRFMLAAGAELIVIACNTASAAALHWLRQKFAGLPFVGMEPAIKPAAEHTVTGHIGVIATAATFQGELFASLLDRYAGQVAVHTQICPDLVPLVEAGELNTATTRQAVAGYLAPLLAQQIDHLVLGCTHYPFLRPLIAEIAGPQVTVIDPAPAVARQAGRVLAQRRMLAEGPTPARRCFYTTGDPVRFQAALAQLLGCRAAVEKATWTEDGRLIAPPFT